MNGRAILSTAIAVAHEAGAVVRKVFPRAALDRFDLKGAVDPVTETDTTAEDLILSRLRSAFPEHRFLAEESGGQGWRSPGPPIWLIDPLDGTNNFAHGFPHVAVSLGLAVDGRVVVGVAYDPLRNETFAARAGGGATLNGRSIHVSDVEPLGRAFLATGFPYDRRTAADNNVRRLDHFLRRCMGVRRAGAAVLDLAYVACGRFDGFWELRLNPWDVAAGSLLVQEAGGRVTDFHGEDGFLSGEAILATNGHVHAQMLTVLQKGSAAPLPT